MRDSKLKTDEKGNRSYRSAIGIATISLLMCGLFFPLLITGIAQALMPYQANGEIVQLNGRDVGSFLIAQDISSPAFFHSRNDSASGVDPDITLQDAYSQIPRIHSVTGISSDALIRMINENVEGTLWIFGSPYVNVLRLNLLLATAYPSVYEGLQ